MVVGILVEISHQNVDKIFDYHVPDILVPEIKVGIRVEVPFGRQTLEGFVLEIKDRSDCDNLRDVIRIVDNDIVLNEELLSLGKRMHEELLSTLISCYQVMLPKALKARRGVNVSKKYDVFYRINRNFDCKTNATQQKIIDLFKDNELISRSDLVKISSSSLKTLLKNGVLIEEKHEHYRMQYTFGDSSKKELTKDQENAFLSVEVNSYSTYLLHGVTGSGKTEVYIKLIEKVLSMGKTAIVLVPEISLTPQMVNRFSGVFGNKIAALHSALSDGEKYDEWRRIHRGEVSIVIGARSACFAPLTNLGIIIIDEEHSDSYKQDNNPRYDARRIAMIRGETWNCPVVLGSATPLLEDYARACKGVYKLFELPNRVNGDVLPKVSIIDMNEEIKRSINHFSLPFIEKIRETLDYGNQAILLLNRRGYSSFVTCKNCGTTLKCPYCDISLTYHKSSNNLRCHYCGYGTRLPKICPECMEDGLSTMGVGTEKIEEELSSLFSSARVLRMDVDTTTRKGSHARMIEAFKNHEYDILLGTQMVAKGLDFPNVTLVGVINADTSLNIPDFRSSENTFSLLSQVAGRSGRGAKKGEVLIQTYNPEHYAIYYAKSHDYVGFYKKEMAIRRELKYPPYFYICYLRISGRDYKYLSIEANKIRKTQDRYLSYTVILGPSPASIFRINNVYRYGIILKYKKEDNLYKILSKLIDHYRGDYKITLDIDFNPNHF